MNYSKSMRKSAMVKRVLILIGVALGIGLVIGNVSGYALKTHITAKDKQKTEHSHRKFPLTGVWVT